MNEEQRARAVAAVLGGLAADAATMPLHWIYDQEHLEALVKAEGVGEAPEFFPTPSCPYYSAPLGSLSPYGDDAAALLDFASKQDIKGPALTKYLARFYRGYRGRLSHAAAVFLEHVAGGLPYPACGADDSSALSLAKVPVCVAKYAGRPELAGAVEVAVRATQDSGEAVAAATAAAVVLERVVMGASVRGALEGVAADASLDAGVRQLTVQALEDGGRPFGEVCWEAGPHTALPGALRASLAAAAGAGDYVSGVRANLLAAGDNCCRAVLAGALLAAQQGVDAIPATWRCRVPRWAELEAQAYRLVGGAPAKAGPHAPPSPKRRHRRSASDAGLQGVSAGPANGSAKGAAGTGAGPRSSAGRGCCGACAVQ